MRGRFTPSAGVAIFLLPRHAGLVTLLVHLLYSPIPDTFSGSTSAPTRGLVVTITTPSAVPTLTHSAAWLRPLLPTGCPSLPANGTHQFRQTFVQLIIRGIPGLRQYPFQHPKVSDSNIGITHYFLCTVTEVTKPFSI